LTQDLRARYGFLAFGWPNHLAFGSPISIIYLVKLCSRQLRLYAAEISICAHRAPESKRVAHKEVSLRLFATDVASGGLNIQKTVRYVVHWDILWNQLLGC
jgi:hypothetical protein